MHPEIEIIKEKIKKLLALSKSDNENEAAAALEKANELLSKYNLDETELYFNSVSTKYVKTYVPWKTVISNSVAWLYGVTKYKDTNNGTLVFVGLDIYTFLAKEMFEYLIKTIDRTAKKQIRKNAKNKFRKSFKYGMADKIYDRIYELGQSCSWAPYRDTNIEEAKEYAEKSIELIEPKPFKKIKLNHSALNRGTYHGNNVSLARQAGHNKVAQITGI